MPKKLYEKIGEACLSFMHADVLSHEIHYLSFICLKGVIISVAIGLVVYFGIVRTLLVKKYSESRSYYINALPEWTDIELEFYCCLLYTSTRSYGYSLISKRYCFCPGVDTEAL